MKEKLSALLHFFRSDCPGRTVLAAVSLWIIAVQRALRGNTGWMRWLSENAVRPLHRFLARLTDRLPFSVAEVLILAAGLWLLALLVRTVLGLCRKPEKGKRLGGFVMSVLSFCLCVYAGFCLLWGVFYYGDDFMSRSGFETRDISCEELETVTLYFAALTNRYADEVPRDGEDVCALDRKTVLEKSRSLYTEAERQCPALLGPAVRAKPFFFSGLLSLTDFTGFFFPFTAEANVNTDFPTAYFPSTVAHELAHQRGVAKEQEANFCAVYASLLDGDAAYCYSACLLAWTHLGNALYTADPAAWQNIRQGLDERVVRDLEASRAYWQRFETPVRNLSNTVYEGFLYSYDQDLGLRSYGACVDLLVCHYLRDAEAYFGS